VRFQQERVRGGLVWPGGGQESLLRYYATLHGGESLQDIELSLREGEELRSDMNLMPTDVDSKARRSGNGSVARGTVRGLTTTAQCSSNAGEELLASEGLGDVVIGASVQGIDFSHLVCFAGQHNDGRGAASANLMNDVEPVATRHREVKKDQVRPLGIKHLNCLNAVVRRVHGIIASGQQGGDCANECGVVIDYQDRAWGCW
jgi:hypothetical protein